MTSQKETLISKETKNILKNVSRTLFLSINILPEPMRSYMGLGYLICRALDSVVDAPSMPEEDKLEILQLIRGIDKKENCSRIAKVSCSLASSAANEAETELLLKFGRILELYADVPENEKPILNDLFCGIAEGMEIDVKTFAGKKIQAFNKPEDLEKYCHLIGGVPGIFWARLYREQFLRNNPNASNLPREEDGDNIGKALQITNILKDIAADIKNGRCYIPLSDLASVELKPEDLQNPANLEKLRRILNKWIRWGIENLDSTEDFLAAVPKKNMALRAAVIWPVYWAEDTFTAIARTNTLDFEQRPKISRRRVYSTIISTPPMLLSNIAFRRAYRFRRETLAALIDGEGIGNI